MVMIMYNNTMSISVASNSTFYRIWNRNSNYINRYDMLYKNMVLIYNESIRYR